MINPQTFPQVSGHAALPEAAQVQHKARLEQGTSVTEAAAAASRWRH